MEGPAIKFRGACAAACWGRACCSDMTSRSRDLGVGGAPEGNSLENAKRTLRVLPFSALRGSFASASSSFFVLVDGLGSPCLRGIAISGPRVNSPPWILSRALPHPHRPPLPLPLQVAGPVPRRPFAFAVRRRRGRVEERAASSRALRPAHGRPSVPQLTRLRLSLLRRSKLRCELDKRCLPNS